jgi:organic radical activating enzyme
MFFLKLNFLGHVIHKIRVSLKYRHFINNCKIVKNKVLIPELGIPLLLKCTLKCEYCNAFSPYSDDIFPTNELIDSFTNWSNKIEPQFISLCGGEPFLHPDYEKIIFNVRSIWNHSQIQIVTNGTLLNNVSDEFLTRIKELGISLHISKHVNTENYNTIIRNTIERIASLGVEYCVADSYNNWKPCHQIDQNGIPLPYQSHPQKAWLNCISKKYTTLLKDHLYRCCDLAYAIHATQNKKISTDWLKTLNHNGVVTNNNPQEIIDYLTMGVMPECSICREKNSFVKSKQIPSVQLVAIKENIDQSYL